MTDRHKILDGCQAPNQCRRVATGRFQVGKMADTVEVEADLKLCAYCADSLESAYLEKNPDGFFREVPA